jgi:hypothetical protein
MHDYGNGWMCCPSTHYATAGSQIFETFTTSLYYFIKKMGNTVEDWKGENSKNGGSALLVRSDKLLLVLASTVILGFRFLRDP